MKYNGALVKAYNHPFTAKSVFCALFIFSEQLISDKRKESKFYFVLKFLFKKFVFIAKQNLLRRDVDGAIVDAIDDGVGSHA
jgi:hypothetical protein